MKNAPKTGMTLVTSLNARVAGYWDCKMGIGFPKNFDDLKKETQIKYEEGRLQYASKDRKVA